MINIYCDESCHLPNDGIPLVVIGGISCPKEKSHYINEQIRKIKKKHGVFEFAEIKWTRVSNSKLSMYKDLVQLFFDNSFMRFRAVVALNKEKLDLERFNLSYDEWYHRIYYLVLREMVDVDHEYSIYADIKDTRGSEKITLLREVLNRSLYDFYDETIQQIELVRSDQIQILQLTDLLIGAVGYANRGIDSNNAKIELIECIQAISGRSLSRTTPKTEAKLNIFKWVPQE